jgi:hypothetical protein
MFKTKQITKELKMNSQQLEQVEEFKEKPLNQLVLEHAKDDEMIKTINKIHKLRKEYIVEQVKSKKLFTHKKQKVVVEIIRTLRSIFDTTTFRKENPDTYDKYKKESEAVSLKTTIL